MKGPILPMPIGAHCQVSTGDGLLLIYGGLAYNGSINYGAWFWSDHSNQWSPIPTKSPCPIPRYTNISFEQPCVLRLPKEVIIITQYFDTLTICTSSLNLITFKWKIIATSDELPLGGKLLMGLNDINIYYLGGVKNEKPVKSVYKLDSNWTLASHVLPFEMSTKESRIFPSTFNMSVV